VLPCRIDRPETVVIGGVEFGVWSKANPKVIRWPEPFALDLETKLSPMPWHAGKDIVIFDQSPNVWNAPTSGVSSSDARIVIDGVLSAPSRYSIGAFLTSSVIGLRVDRASFRRDDLHFGQRRPSAAWLSGELRQQIYPPTRILRVKSQETMTVASRLFSIANRTNAVYVACNATHYI
jgi:hypothetical protein